MFEQAQIFMADRYFKISDRKTRNHLGKISLSYVAEFFAVLHQGIFTEKYSLCTQTFRRLFMKARSVVFKSLSNQTA